MPAVNMTNNVEEPQELPEVIAKRVERLLYSVKPQSETNRILADEFSITLGKQLDEYEARTLTRALNVDAIVYVYLFDAQTLAASMNYYRIGIKLVDEAGTIVYGRGLGVKHPITSGGISDLINLGGAVATVIKEDAPTIAPASNNPSEEMPGLANWVYMPQTNQQQGGLLGGLVQMAVANMLSINFVEERNFALHRIFADFPVGPVIRDDS